MGGKKAGDKGSKKEKETKAAALSNNAWKRSKCTKANLQSLVDDGLLQSRDVVEWHPARKHAALMNIPMRLCCSSVSLNGV
jgi:hypothetical protein